CRRRAIAESAPSAASKRPSWASPARRSVEATPETRFAPELLWARRTRGRRIAATIAVVVVFPLVAETSTEPWGSRPASRSIAPGSSFQRSLPGSVVPPPRPARRESAPAERAAAASSTSGSGGRIRRKVTGLARSCFLTNALYHSCCATEAVSRGREHRSEGPGRVSGGHPAPLHGRADPRGAAGVRRASRALADDEGVRGRRGVAGAS